MYVIIEIRSNNIYVVFVLNRFYINLNKTHFIVAKYVFRYFKDNFNLNIIYKSNNALIDYIDVN